MFKITMPLIKSASRDAVGTNIKEMEAAGHSRAQSVAAALCNARRYGAKFAAGGSPMGQSAAAKHLYHEGFLHSSVPGRTDKLPISVSGGSYILPADHVAALGQGNSLAGAEIVNRMFRLGPYGTPKGGMPGMKAPRPNLKFTRKAEGGEADDIPIIAAGGEISIPADRIADRFGDVDKGHRALDQWVLQTRKKHIKTLRKLKPPKKN